MADELLMKCKYGWRQEVQLYRNYLDVNTTHYNLDDLIYIHPTCRRILGRSLLRLELCFKGQVVVLRGISDLDAAREIMRYLQSKCGSFESREQQAQIALPLEATADLPVTQGTDRASQYDPSVTRVAQMPTTPLAIPVQQALDTYEQKQAHVEAPDVNRARLQSRSKEELLPLIKVPIRLLEGENAHYSTPATWCDEQHNVSATYRYRVKDQGTLILTDLRMIYLGRKSQVVLGYEHLVQVSRQNDALAFLAEHWDRRELFTVSSPLECTMYLEHILHRFKQQSQAVERVVQSVFVNDVFQEEPYRDEREQQSRDMLADEDTQVVRLVTGVENSFAGYEQHMEWLSQLGILR